jgi:hypothetical protein
MRASEPVGRVNVRVAWWMIGASMVMGAVLGLWSFGGPLPPPPGFEAFDAPPGGSCGWATSRPWRCRR